MGKNTVYQVGGLKQWIFYVGDYWIEENSFYTTEMQLLKANASKFLKVVAKNGDILHFKESCFHALKTLEESFLLASVIPTDEDVARHRENLSSKEEKYLKILGLIPYSDEEKSS